MFQRKLAPAAPPRAGNTIQPLFGRKTKTVGAVGHAGAAIGNTAVSAPATIATGANIVGASAAGAADMFGTVGAISSSAAVVTLPVGIGLWAVSSGFAARSIYRSNKHRKGIEACHQGLTKELQIRVRIGEGLEQQYGVIPDQLAAEIEQMKNALDAMEYVVHQKKRKMKRKAGSIVPVLGAPVVGLHRLGRYLFKKDRGVKRQDMARKLWDAHKFGIKWATLAVRELLGEDRFAKTEREDYDSLFALARKMKSI